MSKLAIALLLVPTLLMVGSPSKALKHNPESKLALNAPAPAAAMAALPEAVDGAAHGYEYSLSARAHAASHRTVSPQVMAMVSAY